MIVVVMARMEIVTVRAMVEGMMAMVVVLEIVLAVLVAVLMVVICAKLATCMSIYNICLNRHIYIYYVT